MENLQRTLVEDSNSGWWGMRVRREERAKNWRPKYVWQGAFATSAHSDPHPFPNSQTRGTSSSSLVTSLGACMLQRSHPLLTLANTVD